MRTVEAKSGKARKMGSRRVSRMTVTLCPLWGRLPTCGGLSTRLVGRLAGFGEADCGIVTSGDVQARLRPGLGCPTKQQSHNRTGGSKTLRSLFAAPGRPIDNRPQVANLPHNFVAGCKDSSV